MTGNINLHSGQLIMAINFPFCTKVRLKWPQFIMERVYGQRIFIYFLGTGNSWWWPSWLAQVDFEDRSSCFQAHWRGSPHRRDFSGQDSAFKSDSEQEVCENQSKSGREAEKGRAALNAVQPKVNEQTRQQWRGREAWLQPSLATGPGKRYASSLGLSFPICKLGRCN